MIYFLYNKLVFREIICNFVMWVKVLINSITNELQMKIDPKNDL